jgi:hypothetical protein
MMIPSLRACLLLFVLSLMLASCSKKEGYEIRGDKVIWHSWQGDGLFGKWSEANLTESRGFVIFQPQGYAKNTTHVFHNGRQIQNSDPATFQMFAKRDDMAKDAKQVYRNGGIIEGADPATFAFTDLYDLGKDANDYYLLHKALHVKDMASFQVLEPEYWRSQNLIWARERDQYYVWEKATPIADSASFQVLQSCYAKDAKQVYFGSDVLAMADSATFQGCGGLHGELAKDVKQVFWEGKVVEGCDAASFEYLRLHFAKDFQHAYFCYSSGSPPMMLPGSDAKTFEVIGVASDDFGYAKDAKQVYRGGNVIEGADPATFVVDASDAENASDKNRRYRYGVLVP